MDNRNHLTAQDLDKVITIEAYRIIGRSASNREIRDWVAVASKIRANVQDALPSKGESQAEGISVAERPTRIRTRFRSDVEPNMRVRLHSVVPRLMKITTWPAELGRKDGIEFMAVEFSSEGEGA
jgi:head-tail adaptor